MNSPRLRGLFGGGSTPSKRPESKHPTPTSKSDADVEAFQTTTPAVTPPTTPSISFATTAFPPVPQEEYELGLQLPMTIPLDPPSVHTGKRAQLPPVPRKTTASPVRLGPSLTRLDIGAGLRTTPTTHPHSKPPPPSVVVEEWGAGMSSGAAHAPRPLPSVPGAAPESMKSSSPSSSIAGPSKPTKVASPVAGPSRHANAIAGPSKLPNAIAGPSKYPSDRSSPSTSSPSSSMSVGASPSSKILITEPTPARAHKQNTPSLSMRFQPLVVDPSGSPSADPSSPPNTSLNTTVSSPVRPLPRVPSAATAPPTTIRIAAPVPTRYLPPPARVKRPKTSPSSINGFVPPVLNPNARAAFTTIPNSWASRPVDLNAQRPTSPPVRPPILKYPRARSHSRPRRDRSLDSIYARTTSPIRAPSPATMSTPTHGIKPATTTRSATTILSPGARRPPPSPPTGPVPRVKSPTTHSPGSLPHTPSTGTPRRVQQVPIPLPPPLPPIVTNAQSIPKDDAVSIETLMHRHPTDAFADSESLLHPKSSPIEFNTTESPVEVFLDNQDYSTLSRSPSPIRYARPDSRGNLSDSADDEVPPSDSESSSSRGRAIDRNQATRRHTSHSDRLHLRNDH
ncbi:hypothetical protein NLJ89_g9361 [Agrocybe chaxingu]|uniref:Uncharacterized protein n=1 Tax=Agrocybe chaxingu TaxID=84603 RepID=A0A9W8JTH8_9AGAR|nr:hypothetical protein NLJ89_g9361 [Agrocybe chaxingu]